MPDNRRRVRRALGTAVLVVVAVAATAVVVVAVAVTPAGAQGSTSVVGLGDSVTAGTACDCTPFVTRFGRLLAQRDRTTVHVRNDGEPGLTSAGLLQQLRAAGSRTAGDVRRADLVVLTVGANDLAPAVGRWTAGGCVASCYDPLVAGMGGQLGAVVQAIRGLLPDGSQLLVTTYWNVFKDGAGAAAEYGRAFLPWSDAVTRAANAAICGAADAVAATCVDLYAPFKGTGGTDPTPLLAPDADHPDARGHQVIARALLGATATTR